MKGIVLASHGQLALGMLDTLKIFTGEPQQIKALCLMPGDEMEDFLEDMRRAIEEVDTGDGVVIFCDLLFGSPCNCSARLLHDEAYKDRISVITGMNLSMVLEYAGAREQGMEREALVVAGVNGIVDFNNLLAERQNA